MANFLSDLKGGRGHRQGLRSKERGGGGGYLIPKELNFVLAAPRLPLVLAMLSVNASWHFDRSKKAGRSVCVGVWVCGTRRLRDAPPCFQAEKVQ